MDKLNDAEKSSISPHCISANGTHSRSTSRMNDTEELLGSEVSGVFGGRSKASEAKLDICMDKICELERKFQNLENYIQTIKPALIDAKQSIEYIIDKPMNDEENIRVAKFVETKKIHDAAITKIEIKKFDMSKMTCIKGIRCIAIGRRAVGKTSLAIDILRHRNTIYKNKTICTNVDNKKQLYSNAFSDAKICQYDPCIVEQSLQTHFIELKKHKELNKDSTHNDSPHSIIILDNCLYDPSWQKDNYMKTLFINGIVMKHSFIITLNYPVTIPVSFIHNLDYLFIFKDECYNYKRRIWENYLSHISLSFETFNSMMDQLPQYDCYVFDFTLNSRIWEDMIFFYKTSDTE